MRDPADRREHLGAGVGAGGGHLRALVPEEQRPGLVQVGDLREPEAELLEGAVRAHIDKSFRRIGASGARTPVRG